MKYELYYLKNDVLDDRLILEEIRRKEEKILCIKIPFNWNRFKLDYELGFF